MEYHELIGLHGKYYQHMQKLGRIPLSQSPTIDELDLNKGAIRSCYKEMKEINFQGTLIDYLCYVVLLFILYWIRERIKGGGISLNEAILERVKSQEIELSCCIRAFYQNPDYLFKSEPFIEIIKDIGPTNSQYAEIVKSIFITMAEARFIFYFNENRQLKES